MILTIPGNKIEDLSKWARYPQGMPTPSNPDRAWKLTLQAEQAARADRCDVVVALGPQVRELDPGLHEATFMRDEAIRRCLGLPSLLVPSMPVPSAPPDAGIAAPDADASAPAAPAPAP